MSGELVSGCREGEPLEAVQLSSSSFGASAVPTTDRLDETKEDTTTPERREGETESPTQHRTEENALRASGIVAADTATQQLRIAIMEQERVVQVLRARQTQRTQLLQHLREALATSVVTSKEDVTSAFQRLQDALEGIDQTQLSADGVALADSSFLSSIRQGGSLLPSHSSHSNPVSLAGISLSEEEAEDLGVAGEVQMDLEELLGLQEEVRERAARRRERKERRRQQLHVDPNQLDDVLRLEGFENKKTRKHLKRIAAAEQRQRSQLFAALDRLLPASLLPSHRTGDETPAWLESTSPTTEGSRSSRSASIRREDSPRESEMGSATSTVSEHYSSDFESEGEEDLSTQLKENGTPASLDL